MARHPSPRRHGGRHQGPPPNPYDRQPPGYPNAYPDAEDDEQFVYSDAPIVFTSRSQLRKKLFVGWMIMICGVLVVLILWAISVGVRSPEQSQPDLKLAPALDEATLRKAAESGMRKFRTKVQGLHRDGKPLVQLGEPSSLAATIAEMKQQKRSDGTPFKPGTAHRASDGNPLLKKFFVLRSDHHHQLVPSNPIDIEYVIVRVYRSEADRESALTLLNGARGSSALVRSGNYTIFQHSANFQGEAFNAVNGAINAYSSGFRQVVPPLQE